MTDEPGHFERTPPICIKHRIPAEPIDGEPVIDGLATVLGWQCPLCWREWMQELAMHPRYNFPCWHTPITPPRS